MTRAQSPIDLPACDWSTLPSGPSIELSHEPFVPHIENGPFGVLIVPPQQTRATLTIAEVGRFDLAQIHFHLPAEHRLALAADETPHRPPAEIHFVHSRNDVLAVIGVFVEVDPEPDAEPFHAFDALVDLLEHGDTQERIAPLAIIPDADVFSYDGSLTTAPYSEGVHWFVARDPITISRAQAAELGGMDYADRLREVAGQARDPQPLNGRVIARSAQRRPG